jgi:DNA-binding MarR family transcriptional regulator
MQVTFHDAGTGRGSSPEACASVVLDTSLLVVRMLRRELRSQRPAGLTITQVRGLGFVNAYPDASVSDLSDHIGLTMAATSRLAASLARRGLIRQRIDSTDRRRSLMRLTPRGRAHLHTAFLIARGHFAGLLADVPAHDRAAIMRAMRRLRPLVTPPKRLGRTTLGR